MGRKKKKSAFADLPTIEIKLTKEDILKDLSKYRNIEYPAFSKIISTLSEKKVKHIICLGIGDLCVEINARKQLAFVIKICEKLSCSISFFDPITCKSCLDLMSEMFSFIKIEEEDKNGMYSADDGCIIGFTSTFLPS